MLLAAVAVTAVAGSRAAAAETRAAAGDPGRGALVYVSSGCGACHVFRKAGSTGTAGPDLDRWTATHAAALGLPVTDFLVGRIAYGGTGMPASVGQLTAEQVEDVAAYVAGAPLASPAGGPALIPPAPVPPPLVTAPATTVRAWVKARGLTGRARRGAELLAAQGCLSCHRFDGAGTRRLGAPDLSKGGPRRLGLDRLRRLLASPAAAGSRRMPGYADLGDASLRALAELLVAARH
jgi:mono/diheme cytochrome c family protein